MEIFLKAKPWQIFVLTVALPLILALLTVPVAIVSNHHLKTMKIFVITIILLFYGGYLTWLWTVVAGLQPKISKGINLENLLFNIFMFIQFTFMLITIRLIIFICKVIKSMFEFFQYLFGGSAVADPSSGLIDGLLLTFVPLFWISFFCTLYCFYFAAKTIRSAELQKPIKFSDFVWEIFLIVFFPVGIWLIQPKINKMAEKTNHNGT